MNAFEVRGLLGELVDENPFAVRAVLKVLAVEFTGTVPTLAVTIEERPRLLINLSFINQHCRTPEHVKAALCHEPCRDMGNLDDECTVVQMIRNIELDVPQRMCRNRDARSEIYMTLVQRAGKQSTRRPAVRTVNAPSVAEPIDVHC
jgi:hypothetical protein